MAQTINIAHVQQFKSNLLILLQQKGSKFRGWVREQELVGKADHFERLAPTVAKKRTTRHGDTPLVESIHSRRRVTPEDFEWADLIDVQDMIRILIDPQSPYSQNAMWALGRRLDDSILTAALGGSTSLDADDVASSIALPSSQIILNGGTGMTMDKLRQAKRILDDNDLDEDEPRVLAISPAGLEDLLDDTTVTSSDFNTIKALVRGEINEYMSFTFVKSTRLAKVGDIRSCIVWARRSMGLSMNKDITTRVSERDDKSYSTQVYVMGTWGAVRVEEEGVVQIDIDETV